MNARLIDRVVVLMLFVATPFCFASLGCAHRGGVVGESREYSYDDVAAQIRAEDAIAEAEREENGR